MSQDQVWQKRRAWVDKKRGRTMVLPNRWNEDIPERPNLAGVDWLQVIRGAQLSLNTGSFNGITKKARCDGWVEEIEAVTRGLQVKRFTEIEEVMMRVAIETCQLRYLYRAGFDQKLADQTLEWVDLCRRVVSKANEHDDLAPTVFSVGCVSVAQERAA